MNKFSKILFPVDLSEISPNMVPYVSEIAEKFNSEIHILFVVRVLDHFAGYNISVSMINDFQNKIVKGIEDSLCEFNNKHFNNSPNVTAVVEIGDISATILNYIENNGIDLLIMGTHGRKGLDKVMFGSVAERISKSAPVPILLVNPYKT